MQRILAEVTCCNVCPTMFSILVVQVAADDFLLYMGKATCNMSDSDFQNKVNAMTQV